MSQIADHRRQMIPKGWKKSIKSGMINAISLARYVAGRTRGEAAKQTDPATRSGAKLDQYEEEIMLLLEEIRIKDTRWDPIPAHQRPRYTPIERLAILEHRAARGWSLAQTATRFYVTAETISSWQRRIDEEGSESLVKLPQPVNKFPEAVSYLVQRLKVLCPALGKRKIAAKLTRAGLHLSAFNRGSNVGQAAGSSASSEAQGRPRWLPKPCCHGQAAQSRLARRLDRRANWRRLLVLLAAAGTVAALAILLVGGSGRRSFLAPRAGHRDVLLPAVIQGRACIPGPDHCEDRHSAQVLRLRPRQAVR